MGVLKGFCVFYGGLETICISWYLVSITLIIKEKQRNCEPLYSIRECPKTTSVASMIMLVLCGTKLFVSFFLLVGAAIRKSWAILIWLIYNGILYMMGTHRILIAVADASTPIEFRFAYVLGGVLAWAIWIVVFKYRKHLLKKNKNERRTINQIQDPDDPSSLL